MTTYRYDLSLDDSEIISLTAALKMYEKYCVEQLADGPKAPYWAHHKSIKEIQSRLLNNVIQMSGNSFE